MEGNNLNQNEQVVTQEQQVTDVQINQEQVTNNETTVTEPPKKKSMLPLIIIIIVVLLGLGIGLGYYFGTKGNGGSTNNNDSSTNKEEKKEEKETKKEIFNSNDIKIELDKDGVAYITYSEIDAKDKDIVSDVKSYKVVQAGQSDVCAGNERLLFILNDGTISSLSIDALVCGKKLDVKNKVASLNNVESISQETGKSGAYEPTNYLVYVKTTDNKEYDITKVLLGESSSASEVKQDNDKDTTDNRKDIYNSNDIKIELDKDGVAYITYSEISAKDKKIVSNVKSYKMVQAGISDICEGNKRLLFVLNDGTISSLNIDSLVCGKKLDVKNKVAGLSKVTSISQETGESGANEPTNYIVYVNTSDNKKYDITKVLLGEATTATDVNGKNNKDTQNVTSYTSDISASTVIKQMGYTSISIKPIYSSSDDVVKAGDAVKDGDKTLYISCSFELTSTKPSCDDEEDTWGGYIGVYSYFGHYVVVHGMTGGGYASILDSNLKKIQSVDYNLDSSDAFGFVSNGITYASDVCDGQRSDGSIGMVESIYFYDFRTNTNKHLFNIDHDAGWVC